MSLDVHAKDPHLLQPYAIDPNNDITVNQPGKQPKHQWVNAHEQELDWDVIESRRDNCQQKSLKVHGKFHLKTF